MFFHKPQLSASIPSIIHNLAAKNLPFHKVLSLGLLTDIGTGESLPERYNLLPNPILPPRLQKGDRPRIVSLVKIHHKANLPALKRHVPGNRHPANQESLRHGQKRLQELTVDIRQVTRPLEWY